MPQQGTTKQQRERAVQNTKQRREQALQKKQPQQQQPARATQPQPPQRGTQQAQQPAVILPNYTDRAKKLGELIALYLKGNWNWNDGMQMARQYAPAGTTEAELRAAVLHAAKVQGNVGNLSVRALVQPEVVHPQVNISDLPKQSTLQNVARGLQAPLRSVAAGATQLAGMKNPRGQYGKESGGKPFRAPQSFAESYASDPTFGSALELAFPDAPQWFRVLLGGALDLALDPINLLAVKPVKTVVSTVGKQVAGTRAVEKVAKPVKNVAGAVGTRVMHPTAAKQVAKQAPKGEKTQSLSELGKVLDDVPVYSFVRNVGGDMQTARKVLDDIIRRANEQGINIPKSHNILDFEKYLDDIKQNRLFTASTVQANLQIDLNNLAIIEKQIREVNKELADELKKLISTINQQSDNWYRQAELIDRRVTLNPKLKNNDTLYGAMWEGARAVYRREIVPRENLINKAIDVWKRTKTIWNPATHTRNFLQNFLFRYLTGDVNVTDIFLLRSVFRDMKRLRKFVDDVNKKLGDDNITMQRFREVVEELANEYPDLADVVFTLNFSRNKPSRTTTIQQLQPGQTTIQTIDDWDVLSNVITDPDERQYRLRRALEKYLPFEQDVIRAGTLPQEPGIPISQLPRNWWDVIAFPFRRARDIAREAKENKRSAVGAIFQRAYQAEDVIPALLMGAIQRRKAITAKNLERGAYRKPPLRMDYSSIPETIGLVNIAALPFVSYQYLALRGLRDALRRNPERIYNIIVKPIERSTRITQADDEQGVSQAPRFGFAEREMFPASPTRGIPYSTILPIDPQFAEPLLSLSGWVSRSPLTAIARPFVENRDDTVRLVDQLVREFTPATFTHLAYAILGEPQRGIQPVLQHTRGERLLRAIGINIQPIDQIRIARQQQREAERKRNEPLYDDPATITGIVQRILRSLGW
jgi:hypothetical protein